ncbi:MAG: tetratricopeptide repeat protein [Magnetospirillum sp.]|nr:tetratricopeptide repeat protein [Magnetospirillum sp.]
MDLSALLLEQALRRERAGQPAEAEFLYRQALGQFPDMAEAAHRLGIILCGSGRTEEGIAWLQRASGLAPDDEVLWHDLGAALGNSGRDEEAAGAFHRAVTIRPAFPDAWTNLGIVLARLGRHEDAVAAFRAAAALAPADSRLHHRLGRAFEEAGQLDDAVEAFLRAVTLDPAFAQAHNDLGTALRGAGRPAEAEAAHRLAIAIDPGFVAARTNLSETLYVLQRMEEAVETSRRAIALAPEDADNYNNLGAALYALGRNGEAAAVLEHALARKPDHPDIHFHYAMALLRLGRMREGWTQFEWRRRIDKFHRELPRPEWRGEPLEGRTILLHGEQGLGDSLQFVRYAPLVAARGGRVVLWVPTPLVRLLATVPDVAEVTATQPAPPAFDVHLPLMSLPHVFGTELDTIPADIPYLFPDRAAVQAWGERVAGLPGLKVGLVWAGDSRPHDPLAHRVDRTRSLSLDHFALLAGIPGIRLVSLQKGPPAEQAKRPPPGLELADWMDDIGDFADTAALVANLDLVISVDTSVAHLAGAMGKPVWILSRFDGCWRWLEHRDDSPWYPTARLFRQPALGHWEPVLLEVADALRKRVEAP